MARPQLEILGLGTLASAGTTLASAAADNPHVAWATAIASVVGLVTFLVQTYRAYRPPPPPPRDTRDDRRMTILSVMLRANERTAARGGVPPFTPAELAAMSGAPADGKPVVVEKVDRP